MRRGEIRWYTFRAPDKRRPVLILARGEILDQIGEVIVVPVTRTVRGLRTEVLLTTKDHMPVACALNFDHVSLAQVGRIGATIATLEPERWDEVRAALLTACGFLDSM